MRRFTGFLRRNPKLLFVALLVVASTFALGGHAKVSAADCDDNAIVFCGLGGGSSSQQAANLIRMTRENSDTKGHHDLQKIYANYGLVPAEYSRFAASARPGTAFKDGRIVVDGQTVATGAKSIGRLASFQGSNPFSVNIGGTTYFGNTNSKAFATDGLPVLAMFDNKGVMLFAVLTSCGNPTFGTNVTPQFSCDLLRKTAVAGKANTYSFTTAATATNNAKLVKVVYDFGDGSPAVTKTSLSDAAVHTYTKAGTFTAKVTVFVSLPGNQTVTVTSAKCATVITVHTPFFSCIQLTGAVLDRSKFSFSFTATADFGNGATFTNADFNFGDGKTVTGLAPTGTSVTTTHTYATPGSYRIVATLHFNVGGVAQSATCSATVTPTQPPTPECRPGVPQGSALCTPCQFDQTLPANSPKCVAPVTNLPNTGAGDVIGIGGVVAVIGFFFWRQFIYRKHAVQSDGGATLMLGHQMGQPEASEPAEPQAHEHAVHHRNAQPLSNAHYHRPHRFRPRSHNDK